MMLCADDFGLSAGICEAILELCEAGVLHATSVMVEAPLTVTYAPALMQQQGIQIGLHFNLTEALQLPAFDLNALMLLIFPSPKMQQAIADRLQSQLEQFEQIFGRKPDFIDGHQHIQVFPRVRGIFLKVLQEHFQTASTKPWVRQVSAPLTHTDAAIKVMVLKLLNLGFRKKCQQSGFQCNARFDGIYSLQSTEVYPKLWKAWLERAGKDTLIMCHPSKYHEKPDSISDARQQEYLLLKGDKLHHNGGGLATSRSLKTR